MPEGGLERRRVEVEREQVLGIMRARAVELLDVDAGRIVEAASFRRDLDVDSLALVEYTMALEDDLGVELSDEELGELANVGDFLDLILSKDPQPLRQP
ncbi:MAG: acyl carrier protein [Mycobacteriales bacterium]